METQQFRSPIGFAMNIETSRIASRRQIDNDTEPFLCKICSKAFTKRTSRNRHVLYCGKKLVNLPTLRKSCAACRTAKAKCDSELPTCSRCDDRGLTCVYELTRKSAISARNFAFAPPDEPSSHGTLLVDVPEAGNQTDISQKAHADNGNDAQISLDVDSSGFWLAPESGLTPQNNFGLWEVDNVGFVEGLEVSDMGAGTLSSGYPVDGFQIDWFFSGLTTSLTLDSTFSTPADCMFHTPYLVLRPMDPDLSPISPRSPFIHAYSSNSSQIGRTFLLEKFKSYAIALSTTTLPPFIHDTSLPAPDLSWCENPTCATPPSLPTLEICKSIISLYTVKTPATSPFVWRTITSEKDRFMNEYLNGDEWTVLSMLQAITLYILLRIFDEDSFSVEFDRELIKVMTELAVQAEQCRLVCSAEIEGRRPEWKDWVLVESKRRTVTVLFILYLLFDIKPEQRAKSKVGLSVLPLPAHKQLWEAKTEAEWTERYNEILKARDGRACLRYADLMALGKGPGGDQMSDLKSWMVSVDEFGILVLMAATSL